MTRFNFHAPADLGDRLKQYGSISDGIRESLARYFFLVGRARGEIKDTFTHGEKGLILDLCNGTMFEAHTFERGVLANCEDAEDMYYKKWEVERKQLLTKLKVLTILQDAALVDAIERWWHATSTEITRDIDTVLD